MVIKILRNSNSSVIAIGILVQIHKMLLIVSSQHLYISCLGPEISSFLWWGIVFGGYRQSVKCLLILKYYFQHYSLSCHWNKMLGIYSVKEETFVWVQLAVFKAKGMVEQRCLVHGDLEEDKNTAIEGPGTISSTQGRISMTHPNTHKCYLPIWWVFLATSKLHIVINGIQVISVTPLRKNVLLKTTKYEFKTDIFNSNLIPKVITSLTF